jgi:hypothetical protein
VGIGSGSAIVNIHWGDDACRKKWKTSMTIASGTCPPRRQYSAPMQAMKNTYRLHSLGKIGMTTRLSRFETNLQGS